MIWFYSIKKVERLIWENDLLRAEVRKLQARLGQMPEPTELFTDIEDPVADAEFERAKRKQDNREKFDDFVGDRFS